MIETSHDDIRRAFTTISARTQAHFNEPFVNQETERILDSVPV
jgi:hypothetical protein